MLVVLKSYIGKNYYITLELVASSENMFWVVSVCPYLENCECGFPEYAKILHEQEIAYATYEEYVKKYCND